jgi:hypothetical protein
MAAAAAAGRRRRAPRLGLLPAAAAAVLLLATLLPQSASAQSADAASQAAALRQIGDALGATRGGFTADAAASDPCDASLFPGVACDANGQVTSVSLSGQRLTGASLPDSPSTWAALPGLRTLDAANAGLTGPFPASGLAGAPALATVNLSGNDLSGSVEGLSSLPSLESANLSGNAQLCGDLPEGLASKADVADTGAGAPCAGGAEAEAPAEEAAAAAPDDATAADPATDAAAADAAAAAATPPPSTPPVYCVCATDGLDSQRCKDEVYNSCNADKTSTPAASCGDLESGDSARVQAAVEQDCGVAVTASGKPLSSPSPSPAPTATKPPPAGDVAEVAAPAASPSPAPVAVNSALPVCACALQGFASAQCGSALQSACAPGAAATNPPLTEQACALATSGNPKDAQQAQEGARALAASLQGECFPGSDANAEASPCACFSSGVGSNDCARARVQLCARGDASCVAFQALSAPAGSPWIAAAPNAQADTASYARDNCPVAAPTQTGVQAALTFQGVSLSDYQQGYTQGVANSLAQVGGVPNSDVQAVDLRPGAGAGGGEQQQGRRRLARRLSQSPSSSPSSQATYFLRSAEPEALAQRLQQSAQDGSLVRALGNNGVQGTPSLSLKSYLPAGSLAEGEGAQGQAGATKGGFPLWALAPIIIGSLLLLGLVAGLCLFCRKRRAAKRAQAVPAGKLVVGGGAAAAAAAAAGVGAAGVGVAAARHHQHDNGKGAAVTAAVPAPVPTAYSTDPYADPYAPADTQRTGSEALNAALGGARPAAAAVGVGAGAAAVGVGGAAAVGATRKDIQSVPIEPSPPRPSASAAAAPSAAEWRSTSSASQQQQQQQRAAGISGGAGTSASAAGAAAGAAGVAGGAAAAGAGGAGKTSAQQAERAKFWAQFQDSWQQVRQNKPGAGGGGPGGAGKPGDDEPGTPSSGTQWTDQ